MKEFAWKSVLVFAGMVALLMCAPQMGAAQDEPSGQAARKIPSPDEVVDMLDSKLSLSDDQKARIKPIIAERQQKMRELASDSSGRRMRKARKMKSIYQESDKKIEAVLNDEQKKKYAEIEQQMRDRVKQRTHDRSGP